ncbi:hypothetical protein GOBAR_AA38951 [Gossypium barbadense]|uniref:Uncharacterized protein n=1 Tax=Gossypium barbadense TaxID=3634 RepID=A0A2P5VSG4_GOSBA|nr:hypothetical protein GOBAR_AA38951 [Gossypium barbadense]
MEQLNTIVIQDEERLVAKPRPELVVSEGKNEVGQNEQKSEISSKDTHQPCSIHNKESTHDERRLRIEELDEWLTFKLRKHDKRKLRQNELNALPNQLQVRDKVLLDAVDTRIVTSEPKEETPLTVTSIFPYGTIEVNHPKLGTFKEEIFPNTGCDKLPWPCIETVEEPAKTTPAFATAVSITHGRTCQINIGMGEANKDRNNRATRPCAPTRPRNKGVGQMSNAPKFKIHESHGKKLGNTGVSPGRILYLPHMARRLPSPLRKNGKGHYPRDLPQKFATRQSGGTILDSTGPTLGTGLLYRLDRSVMTRFDDPGTVQFRLDSLVRQLSVPEFGTTLGLYTEEFMEENELYTLNLHIHHSLSLCWNALAPGSASYNPSRSKTSALPPSLRKGVISIGPYVTRLAQHFRLLSTAAQSSFLTLIGQLSPQGISSMLSMRMIDKHRRTYPPQYRLTQSAEEGDPKDISDDVPPHHEDPLS